MHVHVGYRGAMNGLGGQIFNQPCPLCVTIVNAEISQMEHIAPHDPNPARRPAIHFKHH